MNFIDTEEQGFKKFITSIGWGWAIIAAILAAIVLMLVLIPHPDHKDYEKDSNEESTHVIPSHFQEEQGHGFLEDHPR